MFCEINMLIQFTFSLRQTVVRYHKLNYRAISEAKNVGIPVF